MLITCGILKQDNRIKNRPQSGLFVKKINKTIKSEPAKLKGNALIKNCFVVSVS